MLRSQFHSSIHLQIDDSTDTDNNNTPASKEANNNNNEGIGPIASTSMADGSASPAFVSAPVTSTQMPVTAIVPQGGGGSLQTSPAITAQGGGGEGGLTFIETSS
jgi:hypothetical protein